MAKRDRAYELFSQGKGRDDPEVVALGLKKESRWRYHREWKKLQQPEVAEVAVPSEMPLGDIPDGNLFEYQGQTYKRRCRVYSEQVIVLPMYRAHYSSVFQPTGESLYLPPDVMVKPK